jgi:hypothetical protein
VDGVGAACRLAAAGVALMLFDLRIERLDLLNDVVGALLVLAAIHRLPARAQPDVREHRLRLLWWGLLAVTAVEEVLVWSGSIEPVVSPASTTSGSVGETLLSIAGTLLSVAALLALAHRFARLVDGDVVLARSWATSQRLLTHLYAPLTGLLVLLGLVDLAVRLGGGEHPSGLDVRLEGGPALLLLPVFLAYLVPPAHVALSLWRAGRETAAPLARHPAE